MGDPDDQLALVVKVLQTALGGCIEWLPKVAARVRREMKHRNLSPEGIIDELVQYVREGGKVRQVKETRENHSHRDYYYKVVRPLPKVFKKGLFVEIELSDSDPDYPEVLLVNAHEHI